MRTIIYQDNDTSFQFIKDKLKQKNIYNITCGCYIELNKMIYCTNCKELKIKKLKNKINLNKILLRYYFNLLK
jgi:hypothetical protein